jgi:hypothetical protein
MAVTTASLTADATLVVDVCMSVEEGDNVTIICDDDITPTRPRPSPTSASRAARSR